MLVSFDEHDRVGDHFFTNLLRRCAVMPEKGIQLAAAKWFFGLCLQQSFTMLFIGADQWNDHTSRIPARDDSLADCIENVIRQAI